MLAAVGRGSPAVLRLVPRVVVGGGAGGPGGKLGGITFAREGGEMGFPRRTGGIDPSEGSGTKDDVPAMLMAGEFVLTKDAVKGLGDGNSRKGIQRAYNMMSELESRA